MKFVFWIFLCLFSAYGALGNNVRVVGSVIAPSESIRGDVVSIRLTLEWENSWRDAYNHDAVYIVMKYRKLTQNPMVWYPIYLNDAGHTTDNGFTWSSAEGRTANRNTGIFIYRANTGSGISRTNLDLKWDFRNSTSGNGAGALTSSHFDGEVAFSCIGIEMVYIPRGAFALGDMANISERNPSPRTFVQIDTCISEKNDCVSNRYKIVTTAPEIAGHPGSLAANHENDLTNTTSNAWVGNGEEAQSWTIDFCQLADGTLLPQDSMKAVSYISIESIPGRVPKYWELLAATEEGTGKWTILYTGNASDWVTSLERVYPPTRAIYIGVPKKARFYRIKVLRSNMASGVTPVIKTVSMTTEPLGQKYDYTFVVDSTSIALGGKRGLSANGDGEKWTAGRLPATYPNGYGAFYVMKYEMSQDQYACFLQLLPPSSQKARTIGNGLADLPKDAYVFGKDHTKALQRNGIVISSWAGDTASFGCDLNPNDPISLQEDGQPIACNYLTPADMLAYASWTGLRPLTELEYEKMAKAPYPYVPLSGGCAWGTREAVIPSGLMDAGMSSEYFTAGNANFRSVVEGPVRVGIFAKNGTKQVASGASFWGVMNLSDNLSEIYYSANTVGRGFNASTRSNAVLPANGICDVPGWVNTPAAFCVRGGNYKSLANGDLAVALRTFPGVIADINQRDSSLTFRLGYSCPPGASLASVLTLKNGRTTQAGAAIDTVCAGSDYLISGNEPSGTYAVSYIWYKSENLGRTWEIMRGELGQNLLSVNLKNSGRDDGQLHEYWFRRRVIRDNGEGLSNTVKLRVVNPSYTVSRLRDTLDGYGTGAGITVTTKFPTVFTWNYAPKGALTPQQKSPTVSYYLPKRADFLLPEEGALHGTKWVTVHMKVLNRCERSEAISIHTINTLNKDLLKVKDFGTYRAWADGSYAPSADGYRHPPKDCPYEYRGATGSGIYRIDPDGRVGPIEPFDVYCDMDTDGGGWTVVKIKGFENEVYHTGTEANALIFNVAYDLTKEQIVGLKAVSKQGHQYFSKKCYHSVANEDAYCQWAPYSDVSNLRGHYYDWPNYAKCTPNDAVERQADGNVTNLALIPIWQYWGDETGDGGEYAKYMFGDAWFK